MRQLQRLLISLAFVFLSVPLSAAPSSEPLVFGIVPQQSAEKLLKAWGPLMHHLSQRLERPIRFATAPSIGEFEARCLAGDYDIAYMNPYHYIRFAKQPGYRVVANQRDKKLTGILVVRQDSPVQTLQDMDGATLHLPSPNAFAASLLIQAELRGEGIDFKPHFAGSHDSVYRNVERGIAQAGGGIVRTFKTQSPAISSQLRILRKTKGYTPHAIAVHPRLDTRLAEKLATALLELPPKLLQPLRFNPLQRATDSDYDDIRALNIEAVIGTGQ